MPRLPTLLQFTALALLAPAAAAEWSVHTDFEGGSGRVLEVRQAEALLRLSPGGDIRRGWPCWWQVRIDGLVPDQTFTLAVEPSEQPQVQPGPGQGSPLAAGWALPERPSLSHDGRAWQHGEPGRRVGNQMHYQAVAQAGSLWLAWGPPFTPSTAEQVIEAARQRAPGARRLVLATSREGRPVPALRLGQGDAVVWLQARQHAWESGASWVGAGLAEWLTSADPLAERLRARAEITLVPVMDVDHVATGDGGKDALPQDHNRDWSERPHWPEVAAAQRHLAEAARAGRLRVFCDLHNPAPGDKKAFFFVTPAELLDPDEQAAQRRFFELSRREFSGSPIPLEISPRESGAGYHPLWRQISKNWVHAQGGSGVLSLTLETAWNTPGSTTAGYRDVGARLGRALAHYLETAP